MAKLISSPLVQASNKIISLGGSSNSIKKFQRDYINFGNFLELEKRDLDKIKLPTKKQLKRIEFDLGGKLGGSSNNILSSLLQGGLGGLILGGVRKGIKGIVGKLFPKAAGEVAEKGAKKALPTVAERIIGKGAERALVPVSENVAKRSALKVGGELAERGGGLASKLIPGLATAVNLGVSAYRFSQGDIVGGSLSALSAIPVLGWAAVGIDIARDFGAFQGTPLGLKEEDTKTKLNRRLKEQEKKQLGGVSDKKTFAESIDKFDKVVSEFEKIKFGITGVPTTQKDKFRNDKKDQYYNEPTTPIDTGNRPEATGITLQDMEATGGEIPGNPDSGFRTSHRPKHNGNDYFKNVGTPISVIQEGTVTVADMNWNPTGWGALVEIRHKDGSLSRYAHLSRILVAGGSKITPGQVIGYTGGQPGAPGSGNSEGPHLHFEYLPSGSGQVDPTQAAKMIFRFGGNVRVRGPKNQNSRVNTITRQQRPEEFFKGTKWENIFKNKNLLEQFKGEKPGGFEGDPIKVKPTDKDVLQALSMYNAYVRDLREKRSHERGNRPSANNNSRQNQELPNPELPNYSPPPISQLAPAPSPTTRVQPNQINTYPSYNQNNLVSVITPILIGNNGGGQSKPVYIPVGGGGGGTVILPGPSEGQVVNSLMKTMLLTNLSAT